MTESGGFPDPPSLWRCDGSKQGFHTVVGLGLDALAGDVSPTIRVP